MVATLIGAAALPLAQLPGMLDIGMMYVHPAIAEFQAAGSFPAVFVLIVSRVATSLIASPRVARMRAR